jgi:hypothetical protein
VAHQLGSPHFIDATTTNAVIAPTPMMIAIIAADLQDMEKWLGVSTIGRKG